MVDPILAQRLIFEALEGKLEALKQEGSLRVGSILEIYFLDDLYAKHPRVFKSATSVDIASALSSVEERSQGLFKLLSVTPSERDRTDKFVVVLHHEPGRPFDDISRLYWNVRYQRKKSFGPLENGDLLVLRLNSRSLSASGYEPVTFEPNGVQFKILRYLGENREDCVFINTHEIALKVGSDINNVRGQIPKLRKKMATSFQREETAFIEASKGEGYRLAPGIEIRLEV